MIGSITARNYPSPYVEGLDDLPLIVGRCGFFSLFPYKMWRQFFPWFMPFLVPGCLVHGRRRKHEKASRAWVVGSRTFQRKRRLQSVTKTSMKEWDGQIHAVSKKRKEGNSKIQRKDDLDATHPSPRLRVRFFSLLLHPTLFQANGERTLHPSF